MVVQQRRERRRGGNQKQPQQKVSVGAAFAIIISSFADVVGRIVDRFGWPGAVLIIGFYFIERHASGEQKHRIIERLVLGNGVSDSYPLIILGIVFVLVLLAQGHYWRQRMKMQQREIDRLSAWKSEHQQENIDDVYLHHTYVDRGQ